MLALSRSQINLPPVMCEVYQGDTNGGAIGPAVLAPPKVRWQATRVESKKIFGPDLGGKLGQLEADAPEPMRKKPAPHHHGRYRGASVLS